MPSVVDAEGKDRHVASDSRLIQTSFVTFFQLVWLAGIFAIVASTFAAGNKRSGATPAIAGSTENKVRNCGGSRI